jgi:hypothetical protein
MANKDLESLFQAPIRKDIPNDAWQARQVVALQLPIYYVMATNRHFHGGGSDRSYCRMLERGIVGPSILSGSGLSSRRQRAFFAGKVVHT